MAEAFFGELQRALEYLGRYTHRVVITSELNRAAVTKLAATSPHRDP
jgi:hypothetical protein